MRHLERAIRLAERGRATAHPNPVVGAVVVHGDEMRRRGLARAAGPAARTPRSTRSPPRVTAPGARRWSSASSPCAHHGRTPPCVDAVLAAGDRARRRRGARPGPRLGGRRREAPRRRGRRRDRGQLRGPRPDRGLAHVGRAGPAVRHLQGRHQPGRESRRPRPPLDHGRGEPPGRPRAAGCLRRGRRRNGHGARRRAPPRRPRRRGDAPAAAARVRPGPAPRRLRPGAAHRPSRR